MEFFLIKRHVAKISMVLLGETLIILIFIFGNMQLYIYNKMPLRAIGYFTVYRRAVYIHDTTGMAAIVQNN